MPLVTGPLDSPVLVMRVPQILVECRHLVFGPHLLRDIELVLVNHLRMVVVLLVVLVLNLQSLLLVAHELAIQVDVIMLTLNHLFLVERDIVSV